MKNLIFLCITTCIFIFSVIVLNFAPIINGLVGKGKYDVNGDIIVASGPFLGFADYPCLTFTDKYNDYKDGINTINTVYDSSLILKKKKINI
jgi:hypothetical protein